MARIRPLPAYGLAAIALAWGAAAFASDPAAPPATSQVEVLKGLTACRAITDGPARLACYDKAAAAIDQAQASGEVLVIDRAQARAARRQAFGFNLSALSILDRTAPRDEVNTLNSTVAEAYRNSDGKWVIVLEDGAHWRQIDDADLSHSPHAGSVIRIRHASLGSFVMNIDGQPYIRVHRDE
jgi:crotonobetainyl-CoA:carnitine CoA-transferase CaiB-like acyl-CoA transferase